MAIQWNNGTIAMMWGGFFGKHAAPPQDGPLPPLNYDPKFQKDTEIGRVTETAR